MPRKRPEERVIPRIGDVIEIEVPSGLAYAQYTHEHRDPPRMGSLIRVLPGVYERQPDLAALVETEERFSVFFPLRAALRRRIFRIVSNESVPPRKRPFPIFRSQSRPELSSGPWWYWDGRREWRETWWRRKPEWRRRALNEIWNDTVLIERIEARWSPDNPVV